MEQLKHLKHSGAFVSKQTHKNEPIFKITGDCARLILTYVNHDYFSQNLCLNVVAG